VKNEIFSKNILL
jgi:hypothetical protein